MLKKLTLFALVSCLILSKSRANDIEPGKEFYTAIHRGSTPITIDGNLDEWTGVPVLSDPKFAVPIGSGSKTPFTGKYVLFEEYGGGTWSGPDDQTSAVQVAWDADNVYFGFVVTDDYHENSANSAWNGDSVQLMIANGTRTAQVALYNYALGGIEDALGDQVKLEEAGPGGTTAFVARDIVKKKTYYEIQLPAASLGLTAPLTAGTKFGLGMAINDGDNGTGQAGQKGWGGLGAHAIVIGGLPGSVGGKTPSETALVTLSTNLPGLDRLFLSAINPTINGFAFRVTDKGSSVLAPASVKLTVNNQVVTLTSTPKVNDATDFKYSPTVPFGGGTTNTYSIEVKDTSGNTIGDNGTFVTPAYALLTEADKVTPDTSKPGFIWKVHQNGGQTANSISRAVAQLAGQLGENLADPAAQGPALAPGTPGPTTNSPITFEIESVINMDIAAASNGDFAPDDQMAGLPGTGAAGQTDGIAAEITTYLELSAGLHTLIVNSDDGFRTYVGKIKDVFAAKVAGEFNDPAGRGAADTAYSVYATVAGVYPVKTIWEQGGGGGNIEWKEQLADGTKVLLNDVANGGPKTYRSATGPDAGGLTVVSSVTPGPDASGILGNAPISVSITEGTDKVDNSTIKLTVNGAVVSAPPTKTGNIITLTYTPTTPLVGGTTAKASLTFSAGGVSRTETWSFRVSILGPGTLFIEAEDFNFGHGQWLTNGNLGMNGPYVGGDYQDLGDGLGGAACDGSDFGIDYNENNNTSDQAIYRPNTPVEAGKRNGPAGLSRGTFDVEINHNLGWTDSSEWMNYTRKFPVSSVVYKVYARMAHGDAAQQRGGRLMRVTSDPSQCNQTTESLGTFSAPWTGGWDTWPDAGTTQDALIPMKDAAGSDAFVKLSGLQTLRFQYMLGAGDFDYLAFVPAGSGGLPPKVSSLKPVANSTGLGDRPAFEAVIQDGEGVNVASATLKLNGADVTPVVTKLGTNTTIKFTPTASFAPGSANSYTLVYTDTATPPVSRTNTINFQVSFTPFPANTLFIETEDFNFGHGQWLTNKSIGMSGPYVGGDYKDKGDGVSGADCDGTDFGIDYHENNLGNDPGAVPAYRSGTDVEIAKPNGPAGLNRGSFDVQVNNDIGWTSAGEWMNYTRVFPTNDYKVFARMAHGDSTQQRGGELSRVTSDPSQCDQTTESLGTFSAPWTGGWDTWPDAGTTQDALIPMKDANGNPAVVKIGGLQTLRFTFAEGAGDIDYLAFIPQVATVAKPSLSITRSASAITITFEGSLESADLAAGPYTAVAGATSPRTITLPPTGAQKFYRAKK
jgi:hypothetical protein